VSIIQNNVEKKRSREKGGFWKTWRQSQQAVKNLQSQNLKVQAVRINLFIQFNIYQTPSQWILEEPDVTKRIGWV